MSNGQLPGIEIPTGSNFRVTVWNARTDELTIIGYADTYPRARDLTIGIRVSSSFDQIDITELNNPEDEDLVTV